MLQGLVSPQDERDHSRDYRHPDPSVSHQRPLPLRRISRRHITASALQRKPGSPSSVDIQLIHTDRTSYIAEFQRAGIEQAGQLFLTTRSRTWIEGDASYFSIPAGGERSVDAIWTYEAPYDAVAAIKDHVAFYSDRIDRIEEIPD
jgi:Domain of unknown function (DUF427)